MSRFTAKASSRGARLHARLRGALRMVLAAAAALAAISCGTVFYDDPPASPSGDRRVYVNDRAPNDSLVRDLVESGVKLVLQPGKGYQFSVSTTRTVDQLQVYYYKNSQAKAFRILTPVSDGTHEIFSLASDRDSAQFFLAHLVALDGSKAIPALSQVALSTLGTNKSEVLNVHLFFIHKLSNLPTDNSKQVFAQSFFREMGIIYSQYGITVNGTAEIVEPQGDTVNFPFVNSFQNLPGTRLANNVHLYLVESIYVPNDQTHGPVGTVLGFSPREVLNIDFHRESRVILSNTSDIPRLAVTAVHEMGHFFGLRHTVSTDHDISQDDDQSNIEDGFDDTRFCNILDKRASSPSSGRVETPYCLRVAGNTCSSSCDLSNLMHPVECSGVDQTKLSTEQIGFLKTNIALYQHQ